MPLNEKERAVAVATILDINPDECVKDFVIVAHIHDSDENNHDECHGKITVAANCDREIAISMVSMSIPRMLGETNE